MADPQALRRRRRRGPRRRARRPARGPAQPGPGGIHLATAPKSNRVGAGHLERPRGRAATAPSARCRRTCATPTTKGRSRSATASGYEYPHDDPTGLGRPAVPARLTNATSSTTNRANTEQKSTWPGEWTNGNDGGRLSPWCWRPCLCSLGFAALIVVLVRVLDTMRALRGEVVSLRQETGPLLAELRMSTADARPRSRRHATISSASTACSARPRPSAVRCAGSSRVARGRIEHTGDQDGRLGHRHVEGRTTSAAQGTEIGMMTVRRRMMKR